LSNAGISENCGSEKKFEKVTACHSLCATYNNRAWLQRASIIFFFLHPQVGNRNTHRTAELTGVQEQTLSEWLSHKNDD
jgi:hypothetical protein